MDVRAEYIAGARCWIYGPRDVVPRLVLLHGLRGDHHGLELIVHRLPGVPVIVPDLPGFGGSPRMSGRHDVAGYAAWTRRLLDTVAPGGRVVLAGHSFGSVIAAAVAAESEALDALVLLAPIAQPPDSYATAVRVARWFHAVAAALPERTGTALLRHRLVTSIASHAMVARGDRELRRWIHREHRDRFANFADRAVLLEAFRSSLHDAVQAFAGSIRVPVLLVAGEQDTLAPLHTQYRLLPAFADAELSVLAGTGHLLHYERPAAAAAAILRFFHGQGFSRDADTL